ncbi:MAG: hypothetical protein WBG36_10370 [Ornithinimicrobium sp.]
MKKPERAVPPVARHPPRLPVPARPSQMAEVTRRPGVAGVSVLQGLAGNAAVSRLIAGTQPRSLTSRTPPATTSRFSGTETVPRVGAETQVNQARADFEEMARGAFPRAHPTEPGPTSTSSPRDTAVRADRARAATDELREGVDRVREEARVPELPASTRPDGARAEPVGPEQRSESIAKQAESMRTPTDNLAVPMGEAAGHGPASQQALAELAAVGQARPDLVGLGAAIGERVGSLRNRAVHNAEAASVTLRAEAAQQRTGVRSAVGTSRAEVSGAIRDTRSRIVATSANARSAIAQRGAGARSEARAVGAAESARLNDSVAQGKLTTEETFRVAGSDVMEAGAEQAARGSQHASDRADQALALGRAEAEKQRRSEDDEDLAGRKAEAVQNVARRYAEDLREEGRTLSAQVTEQATEAASEVTAEAASSVEAVGQVAEGGATGVQELMASVGEGVGTVETQGREQLAAASQGALSEVDALDQAVQGRAEALLAQGEAAVDAALASGVVAHASLAGQGAQMVDEAGKGALIQLKEAAESSSDTATPVVARQAGAPEAAGAQGPETGQSAGAGAQVLDSLDEVGPGLDASAAAQAADTVESLQGASSAAAEGGSAWAQETHGQTGRLQEVAVGGLDQVADAAAAQADATVAQGATQAGSEVDRVSGEVDSSVSNISSSVDGGVTEAVGNLRGGTDEGIQHQDTTFGEISGEMQSAAQAQDSWLGRAGSWVSDQLSDTWKAIEGMADWRFVASLLVGIGAAILVGAGVALLIASAPFSLPGLAVVLLVGAAAGAAGFAAAQVTGNLLSTDPTTRWYDGVGHAAILGAFVGAAGAGATFAGWTLAAGTLAVMGAAGVGTVVANLATGKDWDDHLLANILIIGVFHAVIKTVRDRVSSRRTSQNPEETRRTSDYEPPPAERPTIVVEGAERVVAGEMQRTATGWECELFDQETGARYGYAEVEATPEGTPRGGPHLTIDPTDARLPDGTSVRLAAEGFSWTTASLRAAIDAFRAQFGRGPANMGGLLAWSNLLNFQRAFAQIRAANPGLSEGVVAERAARAISFGRHRIGIGYGDISVEYGNMGEVTLPDGTVLTDVPLWVEVQARATTTGPLPTVPQQDDGL